MAFLSREPRAQASYRSSFCVGIRFALAGTVRQGSLCVGDAALHAADARARQARRRDYHRVPGQVTLGQCATRVGHSSLCGTRRAVLAATRRRAPTGAVARPAAAAAAVTAGIDHLHVSTSAPATYKLTGGPDISDVEALFQVSPSPVSVDAHGPGQSDLAESQMCRRLLQASTPAPTTTTFASGISIGDVDEPDLVFQPFVSVEEHGPNILDQAGLEPDVIPVLFDFELEPDFNLLQDFDFERAFFSHSGALDLYFSCND